MAIGQTTQLTLHTIVEGSLMNTDINSVPYGVTETNQYTFVCNSDGLLMNGSSDYWVTTSTNDGYEHRWLEVQAAARGLDLDPAWKEISDRMKSIEGNIKDPCAYCGRDFEPDPKYPGECIRCGGPRHVQISSEELRELAKVVGEQLDEIRRGQQEIQREREVLEREVQKSKELQERPIGGWWSYGDTMGMGRINVTSSAGSWSYADTSMVWTTG